MTLSLTLGTKNVLTKFTKPFILLTPDKTDENFLRIELQGNDFNSLSNSNFSWQFTYYKFIYLNFNSDQTSLFKDIVPTKIDDNILILNDQFNQDKFIIIQGSNKKIETNQLEKLLRTFTTEPFGLFTKFYTKKES